MLQFIGLEFSQTELHTEIFTKVFWKFQNILKRFG